MRLYDKYPLAGRDIQYQAPDSRSSNNQLITNHQRVSYLLNVLLCLYAVLKTIMLMHMHAAKAAETAWLCNFEY